jgi:hypothetical protein
MATNPKSDIPPQEDLQKTDNLTIIPGVSKALEQWLRESLKVYTFADLAKLSAQKIRARGKQTGEVISIEELEPILARARELAEESSASAPESTPPAKAKPEKVSAAPKTTKEWSDFANFVVCFERKNVGGKEEKRTKVEHRTGIQHMETEEQASWPGIETDEACKWMLKRLGKKVTTTPEEDSPVTEALSTEVSAVSSPVNIEITAIQVLQPPSTNQPQELFTQNHAVSGYIKAEEPFSLTASFQVTGLGAAKATKKSLEFSAVFHAINLLTYTPIRLGASQPGSLEENEFFYMANLAPITLPPGTYQLRILTTIRDVQPIWNHIEVPLLQVL